MHVFIMQNMDSCMQNMHENMRNIPGIIREYTWASTSAVGSAEHTLTDLRPCGLVEAVAVQVAARGRFHLLTMCLPAPLAIRPSRSEGTVRVLDCNGSRLWAR